MAAAQRGDRHATEALLRRYDPRVLAIVGALRLPCGVESHEVLQAARLGVLGAIASWRPGRAPFGAYAKTCARRRALNAIDEARTANRRVLAEAASLDALADAGHDPQGPSGSTDPLTAVLAREQLDAIVAALPSLSSREAACLTGWLNGRAYLELARSLGGTTKAVALSIRRARDKLAAAAELG